VSEATPTPNGWCEQLYDAQAAALLLYGRALGLTRAEAEDVLQDTFLALMRLAEPPLQPSHFVVRCYRNQALNHHRRLWRRLAREPEARQWFEPSAPPSVLEAAAMRALTQLPAAQREVIVLKVWHRLTFDQLASLLGSSPNTIAARYRYGLRKIRSALVPSRNAASYECQRFDRPGGAVALLETACPVSNA
jgi:RNA polymerase sigma-70 factor (ECF subfamily)